jgi:hypothetical protein
METLSGLPRQILDDLPARIYSDGDQFWYKEGENHRDGDDLPAIIDSDGYRRKGRVYGG